MRISMLDGIFALQYISLTTATILVGFLIELGASASQIGLAASLPIIGGVVEPFGAELIRRRGGWRKGICIAGVLIDATLWFAIVVSVVTLPKPTALTVTLIVLTLQQVGVRPSGLAWTSWISDLIPPTVRGRYFSRRNVVIHGLGAITAVAAGLLIEHVGHNSLMSFVSAFVVGALARFASSLFLRAQPEPFPSEHDAGRLVTRMITPFRDLLYRKFLHFTVLWEFSYYLAAPFFAVYMLRTLGISFGTVAIFAGIATLANLLSQSYWGTLSDRFGNQQVLRVACLILTLEPLIWLLARNSVPGYVLLGFLHALGGAASGGMLLAGANLMMGLAPLRDQTSFFAVRGATRGIFAAAGPLLGGFLLDNILGNVVDVPGFFATGFALLFILTFIFRGFGWLVLNSVEEPVARPHMHASVLLSEFTKGLNLTQGFSPLFQTFFATSDLDDDTIAEAIDDHGRFVRQSHTTR